MPAPASSSTGVWYPSASAGGSSSYGANPAGQNASASAAKTTVKNLACFNVGAHTADSWQKASKKKELHETVLNHLNVLAKNGIEVVCFQVRVGSLCGMLGRSRGHWHDAPSENAGLDAWRNLQTVFCCTADAMPKIPLRRPS